MPSGGPVEPMLLLLSFGFLAQALMVIPFWRIWRRTGHSGAWGLLALLPLLGLLGLFASSELVSASFAALQSYLSLVIPIMIWVLAFKRWPALDGRDRP